MESASLMGLYLSASGVSGGVRYVNSSQFAQWNDPEISTLMETLQMAKQHGLVLGLNIILMYLNDDYVCDDSSSQSETVHLEGWLGSGAGGYRWSDRSHQSRY